jgi:phosphatidylserine/phosphatidylglycerophosphate/cardiolipin synthase-like enzyme
MTAAELVGAGGVGIHIGGSELILRFLEEALRLRMDRLLVLAPYVDDGVFADDRFRYAWNHLVAAAETTVGVRTSSAAEAVLRCSGKDRCGFDLRIDTRLHAKVFVAHRVHAALALAGSHNMTGAALHANTEVGILISPGTVGELHRLVRQLRVVAESVVRESARYLRPARIHASVNNGIAIPRPRVTKDQDYNKCRSTACKHTASFCLAGLAR